MFRTVSLNWHSITVQQVRLIAIIGAVVGALTIATMLLFVAGHARDALQEKYDTVISVLQEPSVHALQASDQGLGIISAQNLLRLPYVKRVILLDKEDKPQVTVAQTIDDTEYGWKRWVARMLVGREVVIRHKLYSPVDPSHGPSEFLGSIEVTFDVVTSLASTFDLLRVVLFISLIAGFFIIVCTALMLHRFIAQPISGLARQIEGVNAEDPHGSLLVIPKHHAKTEVGQAVSKLNAMLIHMGNVQHAMQHMATRDVATNLPNRTLTLEYLASVARRSVSGKPSAVFAVLLDRLDEVKDLIGHEKTDEIAIEIAGDLLEAAGSDAFVGRIGVDSFALVVEDLDTAKAAVSYAEKLLQQLSCSDASEGYGIRPAACIGIALCPNDGLDASSLLRKAVAATLGARRKSQDRWNFFEDSMADGAQRRLQLENDLHQAIENKDFVLHYQPQFSPQGHVVGVESLLRWPKGSEMVPPDAFIPVAEDCGLIVPLGDLVFEEVCKVASFLRDRGFNIPVAVNVSPAQLDRPDFVAKVKAYIQKYALPPKMIEVEITEYALARDGDAVTDRIRELRGYGVRIAIDDFGTGYSSLSYLRRFPVDVLKIDRSFISDIPHDVAVPSAILTLAERLGMSCVAEGIETVEQKAWLSAHNCSVMQGFLMARPMPLDDFLDKYAPAEDVGNILPFQHNN